MSKDEPDVLEMMIRHELVIREFYEACAAAFSEDAGFWQDLAAAEKEHADCLTGLRNDAVSAQWLAGHTPFKVQAVKTSIAYAESQTAKAKEGKINLQQALSVARDIENALLEKQFSRWAGSVPEELTAVVARLTGETQMHLAIIADALTSVKMKGG